MKNNNVQEILEQCWEDIRIVKKLISKTDVFSPERSFFTSYAVIRVAGTIEVAYKSIISDYVQVNACCRTHNYINKVVKESPKNPSFDNIHSLLKNFDKEWGEAFDKALKSKSEKDSLRSLNTLRNDFAHGKKPTTTFDEVVRYFRDTCKIIYLMDKTVS